MFLRIRVYFPRIGLLYADLPRFLCADKAEGIMVFILVITPPCKQSLGKNKTKTGSGEVELDN